MITLIVARARNGAIGRDNAIPWDLPADLRSFQRETTGGAVIMGRRTWESLPVRPLKNRLNIVVSAGLAASAGAEIAADIGQALALAAEAGHARIYGIGGARIYAALAPMAHRLLITEVGVDIPDADAYFPALDETAWREIGRLDLTDEGPVAIRRELLRL